MNLKRSTVYLIRGAKSNMSDNYRFVRGAFETYYAHKKVVVSNSENPLTLEAGDSFEFDGTVMKFNGFEFDAKSLRGAFKLGWVSDGSLEDSSDDTRVVQRNVASTKVTTRDLSHVHRSSSDGLSASSEEDRKVLDLERRKAVIASGEKVVSGTSLRVAKEVDPGGKTVAKLRTPAKLVATDAHLPQWGTHVKDLESLSEAKPEYVNKKPPAGATAFVMDERVPKTGARVIGEYSGDGISTEIGKVRQSDDSSKAVVANKPSNLFKPQKSEFDLKLAAGKCLSTDFPSDWDFKAKLSDKISRLKSSKPQRVLLQTLWLVESDAFRKVLLKEYPNTF